jgi:hypothetical protein
MEMQLKIQGFSGEKKDWERWSTTFLAKFRLRGYRELLVGLEVVPTKGTKGYDKFMQKHDFAFEEAAKMMCASAWWTQAGLN